MKTLCKKLLSDEGGFILSAEMVIIVTIGVLAMIVGLNHVALAVNQELNDVAYAIGSLNQSYFFTGFSCCRFGRGSTSWTSGSGFVDLNMNRFNNCGIGSTGWSSGSNGWGGGAGGWGGMSGGGMSGGYGEIGGSSSLQCAPTYSSQAVTPLPSATPCVDCTPAGHASPTQGLSPAPTPTPEL